MIRKSWTTREVRHVAQGEGKNSSDQTVLENPEESVSCGEQ
jgi:hypothetical protein